MCVWLPHHMQRFTPLEERESRESRSRKTGWWDIIPFILHVNSRVWCNCPMCGGACFPSSGSHVIISKNMEQAIVELLLERRCVRSRRGSY